MNNELTVLRETGCYADFTMPSAPSPTQTSTVNSIYYATDCPPRPKDARFRYAGEVGVAPPERSLLLIEGPLMIDWGRRKWVVLPRLENADLHGGFPPRMTRLEHWLRAGVGVVGRPNWVFVNFTLMERLERNAAMLLGEPMQAFRQALADYAANRPWLQYYYVTAREMADRSIRRSAGRRNRSSNWHEMTAYNLACTIGMEFWRRVRIGTYLRQSSGAIDRFVHDGLREATEPLCRKGAGADRRPDAAASFCGPCFA